MPDEIWLAFSNRSGAPRASIGIAATCFGDQLISYPMRNDANCSLYIPKPFGFVADLFSEGVPLSLATTKETMIPRQKFLQFQSFQWYRMLSSDESDISML